jgi:Ni,Fe-hydrogenase III small subunit
MLALLRDLRRLRRTVGLAAPERGRSLALRHVDAGSCNGCEHELTLASSPYYDLQRFGLGVVASPRHADVLLVTGPVTTRMREPLLTAYAAMPEPRLVAALGDCALGCGVLGSAGEIVGRVEAILPIDLRIPGCPPTPDAIAAALLELVDAKGRRTEPCRSWPADAG